MTVNSLTSTAMFKKMTFNNTTAPPTLYNITVSGSDTNLLWYFYNANGPWIGDAHEQNDVNNQNPVEFPRPHGSGFVLQCFRRIGLPEHQTQSRDSQRVLSVFYLKTSLFIGIN